MLTCRTNSGQCGWMVDKFHFAVQRTVWEPLRCEKTLSVGAQCRKWRTPVVYIASPRLLHASTLFWSLIDPPG